MRAIQERRQVHLRLKKLLWSALKSSSCLRGCFHKKNTSETSYPIIFAFIKTFRLNSFNGHVTFPTLTFQSCWKTKKKNFIYFFQNERMQIIWPLIVHASLFQPTTNIKNGDVPISQLLLHLQCQTFFYFKNFKILSIFSSIKGK